MLCTAAIDRVQSLLEALAQTARKEKS